MRCSDIKWDLASGAILVAAKPPSLQPPPNIASFMPAAQSNASAHDSSDASDDDTPYPTSLAQCRDCLFATTGAPIDPSLAEFSRLESLEDRPLHLPAPQQPPTLPPLLTLANSILRACLDEDYHDDPPPASDTSSTLLPSPYTPTPPHHPCRRAPATSNRT